jgi:hypothetical protein
MSTGPLGVGARVLVAAVLVGAAETRAEVVGGTGCAEMEVAVPAPHAVSANTAIAPTSWLAIGVRRLTRGSYEDRGQQRVMLDARLVTASELSHSG